MLQISVEHIQQNIWQVFNPWIVFFFLLFFFFLSNSSGSPGTPFIDQTGLEVAPASQVLGLKA